MLSTGLLHAFFFSPPLQKTCCSVPGTSLEHGHLITTHGVGNLIASLDFTLFRVTLIPRGSKNCGGDHRNKL